MLASCLPGACSDPNASPYERALTSSSSEWVVRGQSNDFYSYVAGTPTYTPPGYPMMAAGPGAMAPGYSAPPMYAQATVDPFATQGYAPYPQPITQDPWAGGMVSPAMPQQQGFYTYGLNGARPRRYGWESRYDVWWAPQSNTNSPDVGEIGILGVDAAWALTEPFPPGTGLTKITTPQFSYRSLEGPQIGAASVIPDPALANTPIDLPGAAYRFGLGLALQTPTVAGWTYEVGFTPSLATDFRSSIDIDAILFDGHAVAYWQMTPQWMWAFGVQYWDRVDDIIIPRAGVVWRPNELWELRLLFPESRISVFVGTPFGVPMWAYAGLEYHVEAYQMKPKLFADAERGQFEDWRLMGGFRWEAGPITSFIEGGWIFDRNVEFAGTGSDYNIDDGFIGRIGFRY